MNMHATLVRPVFLAALLCCLPGARAFGAQAAPTGSAGPVRFGFQANAFQQKRTLRLILSGAECQITGEWSMRSEWKERERRLELDVVFRKTPGTTIPQIGHSEIDVSHVFPVGDSGVMTPGAITATFRSDGRVVGAFRLTVSEREIAVEQLEPLHDAMISSRALRYLVVPRTGSVLMLIDPQQSKETVERITGLLGERGYGVLETPPGLDVHALAPRWQWQRGTVPTYIHYRLYFEPEVGTVLLTNEEWERLVPEGVSASVAAWP